MKKVFHFLLPFIKMGQPRPLLSFIFGLFKQTSLQFLQQIYVKKCPSSIRCWDSNPWPLECEFPPITTRPGLPPFFDVFVSALFDVPQDWIRGSYNSDCLYSGRYFASMATSITFFIGPSTASFLFIFSLFQPSIATNLCEKCTSSIQGCCDSNPQPSRYEFHVITTRPRLLLHNITFLVLKFDAVWSILMWSLLSAFWPQSSSSEAEWITKARWEKTQTFKMLPPLMLHLGHSLGRASLVHTCQHPSREWSIIRQHFC